MSNRFLPYGYCIQNGVLKIDDTEAVIVKEIYEERAKEKFLSQIAHSLNDRNIPFHEEAGWDKHKIKRVLENDRYLGKDGYPPILSENEVQLARNYQYYTGRNHICPSEIQKLKESITCGECGAKIYRIYDKRREKDPTVWVCGECKARIPLQDDEFTTLLIKSHKRMKQELLDMKSDSSFPLSDSTESRLLENKIAMLLGNEDRDVDEIRQLIMQWTAQRYEDAKNPMRDHTQRLKCLLDENDLEQYDEALTESIVSSITLHVPRTITVRYINGMEITTGKEKENGDIGEKCHDDTCASTSQRKKTV